jgi:hypothetical protein
MSKSKCQCGHEQKEHGRYGCNQWCNCKQFQPCVEPEPQKIEQMWICPDAVGACVGCMRASEHIHNEQCVGGKQCIQWSSPSCVPVKPEPQKVIDQLKNNPEIMAQIKQGMKERREGNVLPWSQVRKELVPEPPEPQGRIILEWGKGDIVRGITKLCEDYANIQLQSLLAQQAREIIKDIEVLPAYCMNEIEAYELWVTFWDKFKIVKSKYIPEETK